MEIGVFQAYGVGICDTLQLMDNISLEFTELQKFKRPTLNDSENMINVDMNSYGVTSASSENPMLKTLGLGH